MQYTEFSGFEIITKTFENLFGFIKNADATKIYGGGVTGSLFLTLFTVLLDKQGTMIMASFLLLTGFVMMSGFSFAELFNKMKESKANLATKLSHKDKVEISKVETAYENDDKIITVTSVDELTNYHGKKTDEVVEEIKSEADRKSVV